MNRKTIKSDVPTTLSGKKLGEWKIRKKGARELIVTIPDGLSIVGNDLTHEDLLGALCNYLIVKQGRALACCHGNIAIA